MLEVERSGTPTGVDVGVDRGPADLAAVVARKADTKPKKNRYTGIASPVYLFRCPAIPLKPKPPLACPSRRRFVKENASFIIARHFKET